MGWCKRFPSFQVFESVDEVRPTEPTADEDASQLSAQLKDTSTGTADAPHLPSCRQPSPNVSDQCSESEKSRLPAEAAEASDDSAKPAAGEDVMEPHNNEIPETGELCGTGDRSDSRLHCQGDDSTPDVLSEPKGAETNSRSPPETTNVLKLETEVRNEYFQAPPLGETLAFQAHKTKCDQAAEAKQSSLSPSSNASAAESERKDAAASFSEVAEYKKIAEIPSEKPGSNSPVRQVLNALQSLSHSRQSPDTAESDDSPSALEMEDIPIGITCVTSEDVHSRPLVGLAAPPVCFSLKDKTASEGHHLDTDCNTSPEGTDLGLSEEEPEMENVLAEAESAGMGGDVKRERVYSVSIAHTAITGFFPSSALTNRIAFAAGDPGHVLNQPASHRQGREALRQTVLVLHL